MSEEMAAGVVGDYMEKLNVKYPNKYTLKKIINVEENHDVLHGESYVKSLQIFLEH